jgi:hypothetical protein
MTRVALTLLSGNLSVSSFSPEELDQCSMSMTQLRAFSRSLTKYEALTFLGYYNPLCNEYIWAVS